MPTSDFTDDEYAAVTAAVKLAMETDRFPRAARFDPLHAALAKFDAAPKLTPEPLLSNTPSRAGGGKRARREPNCRPQNASEACDE